MRLVISSSYVLLSYQFYPFAIFFSVPVSGLISEIPLKTNSFLLKKS